MRLLFVVQRYGTIGSGGDVVFGRAFASRLAARGHDVDVLTSCAVSYSDWANELEPGTAELEGVTVHRLPVARPRDPVLFAHLNARVLVGHKPMPLYLQREWMRMQGPEIPELVPWLEERARDYDAAVFFTYNYYTSWAGLPAASASVPTVFHPTAHDEPPIWLPIYDMVFRVPDAFGFLTEEEAEFVRERFRVQRHSVVTGLGVDLIATGDETAFREQYGLGDVPYLVFVGRLDPHKGVEELFDFFVTYKARHPGPLRMVFLGEEVKPLPTHPEVVVTGFVADESVKHAALAGAVAFVMPSWFESFSITLVEAWAHRVPALVQGRCKVLDGQARKSGGAIPYVGYAEFEAALDTLLDDPALRRRLGESGRAYAEQRFVWDNVLDRYERFLDLVAAR